MLLLALWLIIELNRMSRYMRGGHLSGVVVLAMLGDLVGVDEKLHERWLSVQCCCWLCG